ncbi:hypothetical protein Syun_023418 [Stephania yunnanensis]|uniref:Uncharacterized protein n=1 Tax=Stephania yunnanensis TaxID=152371 RepID=A0AAP0FC60_9MAGN
MLANIWMNLHDDICWDPGSWLVGMRSYLEAASQQWNKTRYIEPFPNIVMIGYHSLKSNQELIMGEGGISLLSMTAVDAEDPQTLRMVAGAIANLCRNATKSKTECNYKSGSAIARARAKYWESVLMRISMPIGGQLKRGEEMLA